MAFRTLLLLFFFSSTFAFYEEPWGKDSDLKISPTKPSTLKKKSPLALIANGIINFHQQYITQIDGSRSSYRPTSSRYMQLAIERYGFFKGYIMGCDRLLRENKEPWVYDTIVIDNYKYKFDPAFENKKILH